MTMTSAASSATTGVLPVDIEAFVSAADDWPHESPAVQAERRRIAHRGQVVKAYCVAADAAALVAAALVALGAGVVLPTNPPGASAIAIAIGSVPARLLIFAYYGLYKTRYVAHHIEEFRRLVAATAFGALLLAVIEYATRTVLPRGYLLAVLVMSGVLVAIEREIVRALFRRARRNGRQLRPVLLIGAGRDAQVAARAIDEEPWAGTRIVGYLAPERSVDLDAFGFCRLGDLESLPDVIAREPITGVIIDSSVVPPMVVNQIARRLADRLYYVELTSPLRGFAPERLDVVPLGRFSTLRVQLPAARGWRAAAKRTFDLVVATTALILLAPLFILVALAVKLGDRGPVFFAQERAGRGGRSFRCWKFRTMVPNAESLRQELETLNERSGALFKIKDDPRITPVGSFLRKASLDELPQLFNVLNGSMSLVGPRPLPTTDIAKAWEPRMAERLRVKPGVTGMWQVSGRSDAGDSDFLKLDLHYVDNWSLVVDLMILGRTIPAVLTGKGAC